MVEIPEQLVEKSKQVSEGKEPEPQTVRAFLGWFGAKRRGITVRQNIREALVELQMDTEPDFESAYIDSLLEFVQITEKKAVGVDDHIPVTDTIEIEKDSGSPTLVGGAIADPTYRISRLESANKTVVSVTPDSTLREATTLMLRLDFSQLPVMQNERTVRGVVSWYSIGARLALGHSSEVVRDYMEPYREIRADDSLFEAIPMIVEYQYVLVRDPQNKISGIVTTSDLSLQFRRLAEPFLLIGEIENHIRRFVDSKFTAEELAANRDPADERREVERVADLTFGEHKRLLERQAHWDRLDLAIDRRMFVTQLDEVRRIRNDVMHFDPDGLPDEDLAVLREFARFLQRLQQLGETDAR